MITILVCCSPNYEHIKTITSKKMAVEGKHFFYRNATLCSNLHFRKYIVRKILQTKPLLPSNFPC